MLMPVLSNDRGSTRIKVFLWFCALFIAAHIAFKIVPMYVDFAKMKDAMSAKAGVAQVLKDEEILRDLVNKANELDLPLKAENFILIRDDERRRMKIKTQWDVEVVLFGGLYTRSFHFQPEVEESFMSYVR